MVESDAEKLRGQGLEVDTVGDLLGDAGQEPAARVQPHPTWPGEGIFFGMPDDMYHSIFACSASGIKKMSASSMDAWASSTLNPDNEEGDGDSLAKMLGRAYHCRICEGREVFNGRYAVEADKTDFGDELIVTIEDIRKAIDDAGGKPKGTKKGDLIEQLLECDPTALVWDKIVEAHNAEHEGKTMLPAKLHRRIEIAAAMIEKDPQLGKAFTGGHAEVSVFWFDQSGLPCKARFDYLKMAHLVDLKSFANGSGKPVQRAIDAAISNYKYYIPVVFYLEAIAAAKRMVVATKTECVRRLYPDGTECGDTQEDKAWCWQWAHQPQPEVVFVFQQTGAAPVTRGRVMGVGTTYTITTYAVQFLKRKWKECVENYGYDTPWLDVEPITRTEDESLSFAATDFGEVM